MRRAGLAIVVLSVVAMCVTPVNAAEIQKGTLEFNTDTFFNYASYSRDNRDVKITTINVDASLGYFATSLLEVVGGIAVLHEGVDVNGSSYSLTDFGFVGALRLNFATEGNTVPFVGAGAGVVMHGGDVGSDEDNATIIAPTIEVGVRFLVGNSASVNMGIGYQHQINGLGVEDVSGNIILFGIGVSAFTSGGPM